MISVVAAQETHAMFVVYGFQPGETSSIPGACVPHAPYTLSALAAFALRVEKSHPCQHGTASEEIGQRDRRETNPGIGGPDGPGGVESSIPTLLS